MQDRKKTYKGKSRNEIIEQGSWLAIAVHLFLAAVKVAVGFVSNSIAFITDAMNNLTDAFIAMVLLAGTKLSAKEPDKKHPLGYGRMEYVTTLIISLIVLYVAFSVIAAGIRRIIEPAEPNFSWLALAIIAITVLIKFVFGFHTRKNGKAISSPGLLALGNQSLRNSAVSLLTIAIALIYIFSGISLEAYFSIFAGLLVLRAGIILLKKMTSTVLGERINKKLVNDIKKTTRTVPGVIGAYDLILHNYGEEDTRGSIHIEVDEDMPASELDSIQRDITKRIYDEHNVMIEGISIYARNPKDPEIMEMKRKVAKLTQANPYIKAMHGFYVDKEEKQMSFDLVMGFDADDRRREWQKAVDAVQAEYPDYELTVALDTDTSDWS